MRMECGHQQERIGRSTVLSQASHPSVTTEEAIAVPLSGQVADLYAPGAAEKAGKETAPGKNSAFRADRFLITFSARRRSCFTTEEHLPLAAMNVDHGQVVGRGLFKTAVILSLHQVIPSDGWPTSWCHIGRLQWLTHVLKNLPNRPRLSDEANQPDVAATIRARQWKFFAHPSQQLRPGDP